MTDDELSLNTFWIYINIRLIIDELGDVGAGSILENIYRGIPDKASDSCPPMKPFDIYEANYSPKELFNMKEFVIIILVFY